MAWGKKGSAIFDLACCWTSVCVGCVCGREREREIEGEKERERERRERKIDFCLRPAGLEMKVFFRVFDYGDVFLAY